ncbi:MAG: hypothetical protein LRY73_09215 [Bacillus sp. (in: Bacteria)]|nr:hypothetical protein [Bacillus sp. (in: firmicutes)]
MTIKNYLATLLFVSFAFFYIIGSWLKTDMPYTDLILTIIAVQLVMGKIVPD